MSEPTWPGHPKPLPDELLSSWLVRVAEANGLKAHTLCSILWPMRQVWNRDIDKLADFGMVAELAMRTSTPIVRARRTTLREFEGKLYRRHNANGNAQWIMPLGVFHRTRTRFGLQYCPLCLDEPVPYYRRAWRLAFVTSCARHGLPLLDRCLQCDRAVNFHRYELGKRASAIAAVSTACDGCGCDFRKAGGRPAQVDGRDLATQSSLYRAAETGAIRLPTGRTGPARRFFPVLHQLMKTIAIGRRSPFVRRALTEASGFEFEEARETTNQRYVEDLDAAARRLTVRTCAWLLDDWPRRFVDFCAGNAIWESWILKDFARPPDWFYRPVHRYLYRPNEIRARHPARGSRP